MTGVATELVSTPSPTGQEGEMAERVAAFFADLGLEISFQEVEPGRPNVIGRLRGKSPGPRIMFLAHLDVNTHPEMDRQTTGVPPGYRSEALVDDGWIFGNGISNMKCAFAGFYSAIQMLQSVGYELPGEIVVAGVVGEIEKAPIDEWEGAAYRGGGLGARYMVHHGVTADFCINGEPTGLRLQAANSGYAFIRIGIKGSQQPTYAKHLADNPIPVAYRLYEAILNWEPEYQAMNPHPYITPLLNVGAIHGGYPFKASLTPSFCNLYLHTNLVPNQSIPQTHSAIENFVLREVSAMGVERQNVRVDTYLASNGYELPEDHGLVSAVSAAHEAVFGEEVGRPNPERYSVSSDNSPLFEYGIPGITYGAGGINRAGEYSGYEPGIGPVGVKIDNLAACAQVYAAATIELHERFSRTN